MLGQAERAILELTYKFPGKYMFHAHQTEFSELGWTGMFEVVPLMNLPAGVVRFRHRVSGRDTGSPVSDVDEAVGEPAARAGWGWVVGLVLAIVATAGAVVLMRSSGLDGLLRPQPAPIPELTFERVAFAPGTVTLSVRNTGPEELSVAQVLVDDAFRVFSADSAGPLRRLESTQIQVPYPWIAGEPLSIAVVDSTGTTHAHEVAAAAETPVAGGRTLAGYVLPGHVRGRHPGVPRPPVPARTGPARPERPALPARGDGRPARVPRRGRSG